MSRWTEQRRRTKRKWIEASVSELRSVLASLVELGDWPADLWRRYFEDE
ncbi:hypothetical protein ACFL09_02425 [Planctomycetota bacterium]